MASYMITAEQIKQLSTAEKLQVMETLWQELTAKGANQFVYADNNGVLVASMRLV